MAARARTLAAIAAVLACAGAAPASAAVRVTVDRSKPVGRSHLLLGATHTQHSLDPWGDETAIATGRRLLSQAVTDQDQALYGWGTTNPNPAPGVYDWHTLDRRMQLIRETGGVPVITLCCAPDWMTANGTLTSEYPNVPPTPDHYGDFADLARRVARRYPDVRHYLVWNEMKGFWDHAANNWDYRAYTRMYNAAYDALKSVNNRIQVGGPYLVIEGTGSRSLGKTGYATAEPITDRDREVLQYWLEHKHGADFLAVDRKTVSDSHDDNSYTPAEQLSLTRWFGVVTRQLRRMTTLPVWYAEDYFVPSDDPSFEAAGLASMLYEHVVSGAAASLRWGPQGTLFGDTLITGGGQRCRAYDAYRAVHDRFARGTRLYRARSSSSELKVLASRSATWLINTRDAPMRVRVGRRLVRLGRYEVRLLRP